MTVDTGKKLIVVSNRLPYALDKLPDGRWKLMPGSGGLVTALVPVLRNRGGTWIGWSGVFDAATDLGEAFAVASRGSGYTLHPIALTRDEVDKYYHGYSNESIWPLFHDLQSHCEFDPEYWHTYVKVNRRFAEALVRVSRAEDFVWIHDYQLMDVAHHVRQLGSDAELAFFLHIPFPPPDIFMKLPERQAVLHSLLAYDLVGLQTRRDRRNFLQCIRTLTKNVRMRPQGHLHVLTVDDREMRVGNFPIGIDFNDFAARASSPEVTARSSDLRSESEGLQIVLGVDRLDYTKGIPQRLNAFAGLLERYPEMRGKVCLYQVVVPSRAGIPRYDQLKTEIERLVGEINGRYGGTGWTPVHYLYRSLESDNLLALYRAADVALVTPLKDGMNLVAKEYCACRLDDNGVLILSEFAGAAAQLGKRAVVVNPYDVEQTADAIYHALRMSPLEQRRRMRQLRRSVRTQSVFWWVDQFMQAAINKELRDFPVLEEYIPELDPDPTSGGGAR